MIRILTWIVLIVGGGFLGFYLDSFLFINIHDKIVFHAISLFTGIFLLVLVMKISKNTGRTLAKYGRIGNLKRMETNILVNQGIYKYMRHPMHLGLFLFPISIAFFIGSPSFILIIAPCEIIFMLIMIKFIEEPQAIRKFGEEYLEYKNQVPWFCFKIKCLKELLKNVPGN
ncbi:MAG: isoprenylcysteine carboxylmethyltransferase family protein [Bacteroidales bacterium]|nr:isoprenylcysteine carboxylmethyltransferase family protein [Bacteroidales bacterium]